MIGTRPCSPEIERAVDKGYRILNVHEVWHFREPKAGFFQDYVEAWIKIKVEAPGLQHEGAT